MPKRKTDKRSRLIRTAVKLAYRHGFRETSLADIAEAAKVPVGNVYYYFKTKDEIGEAIVEQRVLEFRALREQWDRAGSPKERLQAFVENTLENRDVLARGGCPFGTIRSVGAGYRRLGWNRQGICAANRSVGDQRSASGQARRIACRTGTRHHRGV